MDEARIAPPAQSRFELVRAAGADQAAMLLSTQMLEGVAQRVVRATSLLAAAVVTEATGRAENKKEASKLLASAITDLREIVTELGE